MAANQTTDGCAEWAISVLSSGQSFMVQWPGESRKSCESVAVELAEVVSDRPEQQAPTQATAASSDAWWCKPSQPTVTCWQHC